MAVSIIGARRKTGDVDRIMDAVRGFEDSHDCVVQILRADRIFGALHLTVAVEHARRSFAQGRNRSEHLSTEILLYCAAERQIKKAIDKLGIAPDTEETAVVLVGEADADELLVALEFKRDDSVLDGEKDYEVFGIAEAEIASASCDRVADLILEKMALSELER